MQITRASDYAVRVMIHLAGLPHGSTLRQSVLSQATDVPGHFLSKVLQQLVRSGLVRSQRGARGGYALAATAETISLLDVVQAIEGPLRLNQCIEEGPSCERKAWCPAHGVWAEAQAAIVLVLGGASVARLAQAATVSASMYQSHDDAIWISGVPKQEPAKRVVRIHGRQA